MIESPIDEFEQVFLYRPPLSVLDKENRGLQGGAVQSRCCIGRR